MTSLQAEPTLIDSSQTQTRPHRFVASYHDVLELHRADGHNLPGNNFSHVRSLWSQSRLPVRLDDVFNALTPVPVFNVFEPLPDLVSDSDDEDNSSSDEDSDTSVCTDVDLDSEDYLDSDSDDDNTPMVGTATTNIESTGNP